MKYVTDRLRQFNIHNLVFSVLFALMSVFSRHIMLIDDGEQSALSNTYFSKLEITDILWFILTAAAVYCVLCLCPAPKKEFFKGEKREKNPKVFFIIFATIAVCWLPYLFSYWPGGVYSDTMNSLWIATGQDSMSTHEPILYTLLWCIVFKVTGGSIEPGHYIGLYTFTILQTVTMISILASFSYWCWKRGLKNRMIVISTIIYALFPLFPYYAISLWKDTVFAFVIFIYSWQLLVMTLHIREDGGLKKADIVKYVITSVLTAFSRNNGMYVVIFVSVILTVLYFKRKDFIKKWIIASAGLIAACLIIQHPVFNIMGLNVDTIIESLGIPLQQTAYIISTDGNIKETDETFLDIIMPIESWKENYGPITADYIKFAEEFDRDFFVENITEYFKVYTKLVLKNPGKAFEAYLLSTYGFWDIYKGSSVAYIGCDCISWTGIFQGDFMDYYTGFSFRNLVTPKRYISAALWIWCMILSCSICMRRNIKMILPIMPSMGVWLTIMIAVPIAVSFRYVYAVFFCIPVFLMCILADKGDNTLEKGHN